MAVRYLVTEPSWYGIAGTDQRFWLFSLEDGKSVKVSMSGMQYSQEGKELVLKSPRHKYVLEITPERREWCRVEFPRDRQGNVRMALTGRVYQTDPHAVERAPLPKHKPRSNRAPSRLKRAERRQA